MKKLSILLIIAIGLFACEAESFDETSFPQENNPGITIDELEETTKPDENNLGTNTVSNTDTDTVVISENLNGVEINK